MKKIPARYFMYLVIHALVTVGVVMSFRFIDERPIAALLAGSLFLSSGLFIVLKEYRYRSWTFVVHTLFLAFVVIPMLVTRIAYWGQDFSELTILTIPAPAFHQMSSRLYLILVVVICRDILQSYIASRKEAQTEE